MSKIKNWKKWTDRSYINDNSLIISYGTNRDIRSNKLFYSVIIGKDMATIKELKRFSTKKEAIEYITNYMRANPNG